MIAVLLLVSYHVIGAADNGGLQVGGTHPLRLFADFFADLRMPLFAAIAGYVYAAKPVSRQSIPAFLKGKLRRLAMPGAVAITVFMLAAHVTGTRFAPGGGWWLHYITPYAHFWFLQAILVIFVTVCTLDILTRGRFLWLMVLVACAISLTGFQFPTDFMSVNHATYLLPYFLAGILACRNFEAIQTHRGLVIAVSALLVMWATWINLQQFADTQAFRTDRRDLQSMAFGLGGSALLLLKLPQIGGRAWGAYGFTIYLYHVLATSAMRRLLDRMDVENLALNLALGTAAGVILPALFHYGVARHPTLAWLFLGQPRHSLRHKVSQNTI